MTRQSLFTAGAAIAVIAAGTAAGMSIDEWKARPINAAQEVPKPVGNPTATARASFELEDGMIHYKLRMRSPIDDVFMAHIHSGAKGGTGPIVVWLFGGPPPNPGNATDFGKGDIVAEGDLPASAFVGPLAGKSLEQIAAALSTGNYYVNMHTLRNPSGEIRGQVMPDD